MARDEKKDEIKDICRNRRAFHEYEVLDRLECGLVPSGTEVKSLREGEASIEEAYAKAESVRPTRANFGAAHAVPRSKRRSVRGLVITCRRSLPAP